MNSHLDNLIKQYVICRENCTLLFIESLAMNGFIKYIHVEDCERKNFKKIIVELLNEQRITSECRFKDEIEHSIKIINTYIDFSKKYGSRSNLKIAESKQSEE